MELVIKLLTLKFCYVIVNHLYFQGIKHHIKTVFPVSL